MNDLIRFLGRAPGFVAFGIFQAAGLFLLTAYKIDVAPLTAPLGVINAAVYGGGFLKHRATKQNGNGK